MSLATTNPHLVRYCDISQYIHQHLSMPTQKNNFESQFKYTRGIEGVSSQVGEESRETKAGI